ncbi:MAG TPA: hypothetical protein VJA19_01030 [Pseudomonas sp.]|nr:hypothetical protein [Pseudomonas sp.]
MHSLKVVCLATVLFFTGCASHKPNNLENTESTADLRLYQLYIDPNGDLLDPGNREKITDESTYVDNILKNFETQKAENPDLQLTLFIHGGLNTFESATARVKRAQAAMLADDKYPLFISWDSAALSNYSDHLFLLRNGIKARKLGPVSSPFVWLEDMLRSLARLPASTYNVVAGQNSVRINNYSPVEVAADRSLLELKAQGFTLHNSDKDTGHTVGDWWSIWNPVKLATAPFVDGLGTGAWDSMLRRTDLVLRRDVNLDGVNSPGPDTAVTTFLNRYAQTQSKHAIIIIGHSMGTIVANNIIAKYSKLTFSDIVYMAAACKMKDIEYVVAPYLENHPKTEFYNLSLNPYRDISENIYHDFIPRGSLLMWIDQTLGGANSFQDRTAGYWFNIVLGASEAFKNNQIRKRVHLTQFGIRDKTPQNHGDFGEFKFWKDAFWKGGVGLYQASRAPDRDQPLNAQN